MQKLVFSGDSVKRTVWTDKDGKRISADKAKSVDGARSHDVIVPLLKTDSKKPIPVGSFVLQMDRTATMFTAIGDKDAEGIATAYANQAYVMLEAIIKENNLADDVADPRAKRQVATTKVLLKVPKIA